VSVAGKAAEMEFCGLEKQTLGVGGDFVAIRRSLGMMARAGMLGPLGGAMVMRVTPNGAFSSIPPEMAEAMEEVFQRILKETRTALRENSHIVKALVSLLMEKEELFADEVEAFFDQFGLKTPKPTMFKD